MFRRYLTCIALTLGLMIPAVAVPNVGHAITINIQIGTSINSGRGISCSEGERLLRNRGFRDIRRVDCRGRYFIYRGTRSGWRYEVAIRSSNGRVVDFRRLRRR